MIEQASEQQATLRIGRQAAVLLALEVGVEAVGETFIC